MNRLPSFEIIPSTGSLKIAKNKHPDLRLMVVASAVDNPDILISRSHSVITFFENGSISCPEMKYLASAFDDHLG